MVLCFDSLQVCTTPECSPYFQLAWAFLPLMRVEILYTFYCNKSPFFHAREHVTAQKSPFAIVLLSPVTVGACVISDISTTQQSQWNYLMFWMKKFSSFHILIRTYLVSLYKKTPDVCPF